MFWASAYSYRKSVCSRINYGLYKLLVYFSKHAFYELDVSYASKQTFSKHTVQIFWKALYTTSIVQSSVPFDVVTNCFNVISNSRRMITFRKRLELSLFSGHEVFVLFCQCWCFGIFWKLLINSSLKVHYNRNNYTLLQILQ